MEKVNGIGGVFFVAKKPEGLSRWYSQYLGVDCAPPTYDAAPWRQDAGPAVFAPLPESTTYFGDARRTWIINFRVRDLDAMAAQLQRGRHQGRRRSRAVSERPLRAAARPRRKPDRAVAADGTGRRVVSSEPKAEP